MKDNWNKLKGFVETGAKMNPHDCGHGIKKAYRNILQLMTLMEEGKDVSNVVFDNGDFYVYEKKNIFEL